MKNLSNSAKMAQEKAVVLGTKEVEKNLLSKVVIVPTETLKSKEEKVQLTELVPQPAPQPIPQEKILSSEMQAMTISIEKLADKAERLFLLKQKYEEIKGKRKQVDNFSISHDNNNAQLTLVDANGMSIKTSNPISIKKLLEDWIIDLDVHMSRVENEMRQELAEA